MDLGAITTWGASGAFGLGVVAALHPCPLSTLAGTLLIVLAPGSRRPLERAGTLVLGMVVALAFVAAAIGGSLAQARVFSSVLPDLLRPFLPPLLIVAGIFQTGIFRTTPRTQAGSTAGGWMNVDTQSAPRLFGLGMVFALSFCPATAGLFFGVLIPLATTHGRPVLYGFLYALGYGLPLLAVAACLAAGTRFEAVRRYAVAGSALSGWGLVVLGTWLTWKLW